MKKDGYVNGKEAIECMISRIKYLYFNNIKADKEELSLLNQMYSIDRLAAVAFGADISQFPRRLKINTRLPK